MTERWEPIGPRKPWKERVVLFVRRLPRKTRIEWGRLHPSIFFPDITVFDSKRKRKQEEK